jgi:hypothetical protein
MQSSKIRILFGLSALLAQPLVVHSQSWTFTGSLKTAQASETATLLNNGQVLVAGGRQRGNFNLTTAELYNPSTATFSTTGSLNTGRNSHTATLLENGEVLIAGGQAQVGTSVVCLAGAELYNPSTGKFTVTGSMATARCGHTATLLNNGLVLIAGGGNSGNVVATAELYNPSTGTFTATGSMTTQRSAHTATLLRTATSSLQGAALPLPIWPAPNCTTPRPASSPSPAA